MILAKVANTELIQALDNNLTIAEHYQNYESKYGLQENSTQHYVQGFNQTCCAYARQQKHM